MPAPDATVATVVLLTGAETALLHLLTAEVAGSFERAPMGWGWLWALGVVAFSLPRVLHGAGLERLYPLLLGLAIVASVLLAVHNYGYPAVALWDAAWLSDAASAAVKRGGGTDRNVLLAVVTVLVVWWRQVRRETPSSDEASALFGIGPLAVAGLMVLALFTWGITGERIQAAAWNVAAFFALALLALAYTRWIETPQRSTGGRAAIASWVGSTTGPLVVAVAVTIALSGLIFGTFGPVVSVLAGMLSTVVLFIIVLIVTVLQWLTYAAAALLSGVLSAFNIRVPAARPPTPPSTTEATQRDMAERLAQGPDWTVWLFALLVAILVLWLLARMRPRYRRKGEGIVARESVWERPHLGGKLRALLRRRPARAEDPLRALAADPAWRHTVEVRRAYRDVQHLYEQEGRGRPPAQTPSEHAAAHPTGSLAELAALYNQARYSTRPAPAELADRARALRRAIRDGLRGQG